jgi:hypothetical protein
VFLFRKPLKAHPAAFYIYPVIYALWNIFYGVAQLATSGGNPPYRTQLYETLGGDNSFILNLLDWLGHLGLTAALGIGLLIIVMFIGVLPKTELVKKLFSVRTEMSVNYPFWARLWLFIQSVPSRQRVVGECKRGIRF